MLGCLYRELGDARGESDARFWIGCFHQVARRGNATALPVLERSLELASPAGDKAAMAEVLRHLGIEAHAALPPSLAALPPDEAAVPPRLAGAQPDYLPPASSPASYPTALSHN